MLISLAIGDAYGAGREFIPVSEARKKNDLLYRQHPKWKELKPGQYTDDTQMTLALAEFMLDQKEQKVAATSLNLARYFLKTFKREDPPRTGYAKGFFNVLLNARDETDLIGTLLPHSFKNGGAMRAAPCGLLGTEQEAIDAAMWQASLTHATYEGMMAAAGTALLVWACRHGVPREHLSRYMIRFLPGYPWFAPWIDPVGTQGMDAPHAALMAIQRYDNMRDILLHCIDYTGDTDTVATIAMAAASLHPDIEQNLPEHLFDDLEDGYYGRTHLQMINSKLMAAYPMVKAALPIEDPPSESFKDILGNFDERRADDPWFNF